MFDLYLIIIPFFTLLTFFTLYTLKTTLSEPNKSELNNYEKVPSQQTINDKVVKPELQPQTETQIQTAQQSNYKNTLSYLMRNFTLANFCFAGRSRNNIPLLFTLSIIALLALLIRVPFIFCFVGSVVFITFCFMKMLLEGEEEDEPIASTNATKNKENAKNTEPSQNEKTLQILMIGATLLINVSVMYLTYKNYYNEVLSAAVINFAIAAALDNFLIRPLALVLFAYPIRNVEFICTYIRKQQQIEEILQNVRVRKLPGKDSNAIISAFSPKKKRTSPTKVPKASSLQIEPNPHNKQNQYISTLDLTKQMISRKPKLSPIALKKNSRLNQEEGDCSLISILNSNEKKRNNNSSQNHSAKKSSLSFDFDKTLFEENENGDHEEPIEEQFSASKFNNNPHTESRRKNKLYTSKIIINPDVSIIDKIDIENQEENIQQNDERQEYFNNGYKDKGLRQSDRKSTKNYDPLKVSLHGSIEDDQFNENQNNEYQNRPGSIEDDSSFTQNGGAITSSRRKAGLLKISEEKNGEDLQEIDLNSPNKKKRQLGKIDEESEHGSKMIVKKKKPHKKYSLDPNRHVIKHTTGEPYLEYLPQLLNKERQQKAKRSHQSSQQQFSRKIELMGKTENTRLISSVKRTKNSKDPIVRGMNDENRIPQFIIEDFA